MSHRIAISLCACLWGFQRAIVQLGIPGVITGIEVNTAYFTGNYVPAISIQAAKDVTVRECLLRSKTGAAWRICDLFPHLIVPVG